MYRPENQELSSICVCTQLVDTAEKTTTATSVLTMTCKTRTRMSMLVWPYRSLPIYVVMPETSVLVLQQCVVMSLCIYWRPLV